MVDFLLGFSQSTGIYSFMNTAWAWPVVESLHFLGMCLLVGTVGLFDLRMLGVGEGIPMNALHKLIPLGVYGFILNVTTGILFLSTAPDQYIYNPAFQIKMSFLLVAGLNMVVFNQFALAGVKHTSAQLKAPMNARLMGCVSLLCWTIVIVGGRLITYYRPPYHWCYWC